MIQIFWFFPLTSVSYYFIFYFCICYKPHITNVIVLFLIINSLSNKIKYVYIQIYNMFNKIIYIYLKICNYMFWCFFPFLRSSPLFDIIFLLRKLLRRKLLLMFHVQVFWTQKSLRFSPMIKSLFHLHFWKIIVLDMGS